MKEQDFQIVNFTVTFKGGVRVSGDENGGMLGGITGGACELQTEDVQYEDETNAALLVYLVEGLLESLRKKQPKEEVLS